MDKLKIYNKKRDLTVSGEPAGIVRKDKKEKLKTSNKSSEFVEKDKKLIFVVQHHIASHDHYDFRLEWQGVLLSWAVPKGPSFNPEDKRLAVQVEDHPLDYATFEGTIPKGNYGGGTVMLWDSGTWQPYKGRGVDEGLKKGELKFELKGKRLKGRWVLIKLKKPDEKNWLLIKETDAYAKTDAGISGFDTSVKTVRAMDEITAGIKAKSAKLNSADKTNTTPTKSKDKNSTSTEVSKNTLPKDRLKLADKNRSDIQKELKNFITKNGQDIYIGNVKISNPDKLLFDRPKVKKLDVALYYAYMAKYILPYINGRVLSVIRCPSGISGEKFYKKHPAEGSKNIKIVQVLSVDKGNGNKTKTAKNSANENTGTDNDANKNSQADNEPDKNTDYFYIDSAGGLVAEAQMDTIEFHAWGSKYKTLEKPDVMVFDLDPSKDLSIKQLRQGVRDLKGILDKLGLISFLKTSGGKGYHIVVPFQPSADWQTFRDFAKRISETMEEIWPDRYTSNMRMDKRQGKIFVDWERNIRGSTTVAPYSIRARPDAPVSMPIAWEELDKIKPNQITMKKAILKAEETDPWKDFFTVKQKLK